MGDFGELDSTVDEICRRLADGESLRTICADPEMPSDWALRVWLRSEPALAERVEAARDASVAARVADLIAIADDHG